MSIFENLLASVLLVTTMVVVVTKIFKKMDPRTVVLMFRLFLAFGLGVITALTFDAIGVR